ncbi:uncharacterized protein LOC128787903 [Vidua chalybeata]|uniref:uncharacterized protein LOC128787903 n=1 Tax=Vidua chalybeata TaxID=81927 RepID=UPI0023A7BC8C|nr:uncharacterized protein LOC128787903 [Vidua chalybeata]
MCHTCGGCEDQSCQEYAASLEEEEAPPRSRSQPPPGSGNPPQPGPTLPGGAERRSPRPGLSGQSPALSRGALPRPSLPLCSGAALSPHPPRRPTHSRPRANTPPRAGPAPVGRETMSSYNSPAAPELRGSGGGSFAPSPSPSPPPRSGIRPPGAETPPPLAAREPSPDRRSRSLPEESHFIPRSNMAAPPAAAAAAAAFSSPRLPAAATGERPQAVLGSRPAGRWRCRERQPSRAAGVCEKGASRGEPGWAARPRCGLTPPPARTEPAPPAPGAGGAAGTPVRRRHLAAEAAPAEPAAARGAGWGGQGGARGMPRAAARGAGAAAALFWAALPAAGEPGRAEPSGALLPFADPLAALRARLLPREEVGLTGRGSQEAARGPACCWPSEGSPRAVSSRAG